VIDTDLKRLKVATEISAYTTFNSVEISINVVIKAVRDIIDSKGYDIVIEAVGILVTFELS
jgi:threonine dehydrogenase-like Zn-dependent dehydrogenase